MKILIVNTFYYPNMQGGAEQSTKLLAENLAKDNDVALFCIDGKNNSTEEINGVKVYRVFSKKFNLYKFDNKKENMGKFKKFTQKMLTYYNSEIVDAFVDVCRKFKPQVIHTSSMYGIPCKIWKMARNMNIPVDLLCQERPAP